MMNYSNNALNFSYLLLDYYKELNIKENELAVILMIDHLLSQDNEFITKDVLQLKMSLSSKEIDNAMTSLYQKKYIEFVVENNTAKTSIRPLKKILYKKFEQSIFSEEELKRNEESVKLREEVFSLLEEVFSRSLSPIEISRADEWIKANVDRDIIINSIKDAKVRNELSINAIDRILEAKSLVLDKDSSQLTKEGVKILRSIKKLKNRVLS